MGWQALGRVLLACLQFDSYVSDPAKPVPFLAYYATAVPPEYMVSDQRFAATRPDVLTYETAPLEDDVTVAGPVSPKLFRVHDRDGLRLGRETHRRVPA